ncbi:unnamed protein product [Ambrosiozyma monospora]|uniref:Unnamed protein product n=1 Tax=Ambrosiozyma monospora TaxID=43982 RepID=A0A9W7DIV9_AMBMO|nr:unnamed protein product [Ambrosiozyma monospora]
MMDRLYKGQANEKEIDMALEITKRVEGHSICAMGEAFSWPYQGLVRHFKPLMLERIKEYKTKNGLLEGGLINGGWVEEGSVANGVVINNDLPKTAFHGDH